MNKKVTTQSGFTLIEMIVSLGLFSIVVTVAVGALLMLVATNAQLQGEQAVMSNLSFALDSMTREMRTGTHYYCEWGTTRSGVFGSGSGADIDTLRGDTTRNCYNGNPSVANNGLMGISFKEGGNSITESSERILYFYDRGEGKIFRKVGSETPQSITSSDIFIKSFNLFVSGSVPLSAASTERDQALVTLFIEAAESNDANAKSHYIQTTVTQRTLDL